MGKTVFAMNLSLDGYVDHDRFAPDPALFRHWIDAVAEAETAVYGRVTYELMRYWDEDQPGWSDAEHAFARAYRRVPKWVVSGSLTEVGPNATLARDAEALVGRLRREGAGTIDLAGPALVHSLAATGLVDEYRLYYHPVVLGQGRPLFRGPLPRLRTVASDRIGPDVIRLTCVPARGA